MGFKEEVEQIFGKKYPASVWWNIIDSIVHDTMFSDIADSFGLYYSCGDESRITEKQKEFVIREYRLKFKFQK